MNKLTLCIIGCIMAIIGAILKIQIIWTTGLLIEILAIILLFLPVNKRDANVEVDE